MNRKKVFVNIPQLLYYTILLIGTVVAVFPLYWVLASSVRVYQELYTVPASFFPKSFTLRNYINVLTYTRFTQFFSNSIIVSVATTVITVAIGCMAAYGITRPKLRGKGLIGKAVLVAYMFPPVILIIPLFQIIAKIGLSNTTQGIILTYITFSFPFCTWMLTSYIKTIPTSIEESASIDGALNIQIFFKIIIPLIKPALATSAIFTFINAWNEFLYSFVIATSDTVRTLPAGLYALMTAELMDWGMNLGWISMMLIPSTVVFSLISKNIVGGLTAGAVKG